MCQASACRPDYEWARWPIPDVGTYTVATDTVVDTGTNLMWQRTSTGGWHSQGWYQAVSACDALTQRESVENYLETIQELRVSLQRLEAFVLQKLTRPHSHADDDDAEAAPDADSEAFETDRPRRGRAKGKLEHASREARCGEWTSRT